MKFCELILNLLLFSYLRVSVQFINNPLCLFSGQLILTIGIFS